MNDNGQYAAAVEICETGARGSGHLLSVWQQVDEHLHASMCEVCGAMALVVRPGNERCWRTGGKALEQECLKEGDRYRSSERSKCLANPLALIASRANTQRIIGTMATWVKASLICTLRS